MTAHAATGPPGVPQAIGRVDRVLQRGGARYRDRPCRIGAGDERAGNAQLDSWIAVGSDGRVTAYTGKCELGQGLYTAQTQLIAEELGVPLDRVTLIQCDTASTPDQGTTSGAQSHHANFNRGNLALAAATAREGLIRLASARLGVPADRLAARDGAVAVAGDSARSVSYADLVGGRRFDLPLDANAKRRSPADWTVLGTPVPRLDLPAMAAGRFEFVHNVRVDGMLHGAVVRPPRVNATLLGVDEASVRDLPGFVRVVVRKNFVGVVFEKPWQAVQASSKLRASWSEGGGLPAGSGLYEYLRSRTPRRSSLLVDSGDVDKRLQAAVARREGHVSLSVPDARCARDVVCRRRRAWG